MVLAGEEFCLFMLLLGEIKTWLPYGDRSFKKELISLGAALPENI
jgi:hypothetical protein